MIDSAKLLKELDSKDTSRNTVVRKLGNTCGHLTPNPAIAIIANKTGFRGSKRGADRHLGLASTE